MKPAPFDYIAPRSLDEAVAALAHGGADAKVLAGGQSLIPLLNFRLARPSLLVDLKRVAELSYVRPRERGLAVGAMGIVGPLTAIDGLSSPVMSAVSPSGWSQPGICPLPRASWSALAKPRAKASRERQEKSWTRLKRR